MTTREKLAAWVVGIGSLAAVLIASRPAHAATATTQGTPRTPEEQRRFLSLFQQALSLLNRWSAPIDGQWSAAMGEAVRGFQVSQGLPATGQADDVTGYFLARVVDAANVSPSMRANAYEALRRHGYTQSDLVARVRAFQNDYQQLPTGFVDTETLAMLADLGWRIE